MSRRLHILTSLVLSASAVLFLGSCAHSQAVAGPEDSKRPAPACPEFTPGVEPHMPAMIDAVGKIKFPAVDESSGLVRSERWPGVFWTHNDSGDSPRIFAIRADGTLVQAEGASGYAGIQIDGARAFDWEDIARGPDGTLYLGDTGNNANDRHDLGIYVVPEPDPYTATSAQAARRLSFIYPDQEAFPPGVMNFDCEALFFANGSLYLLTKHRSDSKTKLYRLPSLVETSTQTLELLAVLDIHGMVTAADASPDGKRIAILTYSSVWVFESGTPGAWFAGKGWSLGFLNGRQCESVCFDGDSLLVGNEQRSLFRVPLSSLHPLRDMKTTHPAANVSGSGDKPG